SLRDNVRSAFHPDDHRHRNSGRALSAGRVWRPLLSKARRAKLASRRRGDDGAGGDGLGGVYLVGIDLHDLADVWHRKPTAGGGDYSDRFAAKMDRWSEEPASHF